MIALQSGQGPQVQGQQDVLSQLDRKRIDPFNNADTQTEALMALFSDPNSKESPESFDQVLKVLGNQNLEIKNQAFAANKKKLEELESKNSLASNDQLANMFLQNNVNSNVSDKMLSIKDQNTQGLTPAQAKLLAAKNLNMQNGDVKVEVPQQAEKSFFMNKEKLLNRFSQTFDDWPKNKNINGQGTENTSLLNGKVANFSDEQSIIPNIKQEILKGQKIQEANKLRGLSTYKNASGEIGMKFSKISEDAPFMTTGEKSQIENLNLFTEKKSLPNLTKNLHGKNNPDLNLYANNKNNIFVDQNLISSQSIVTNPNQSLHGINGANFDKTINLDGIKGSSEQEVLNKITQQIQSSNLGTQKDLKFTVTSQELGKIEIQVQRKNKMEDLEIKISTQSKEAQDFFKDNRHDLVNKLTRSGISVAELKIENSNNQQNNSFLAKGEKSAAYETDKFSSQTEYNRNDEQNAHKDSLRRKNLWEQINRGA